MADAERNAVVCDGCGAKNEPGARKCAECGDPLPTGAAARRSARAADEDDDDRPRRRRRDEDAEEEGPDPGAASLLIPIGVSGWAVAAGYLGLVGCIPFVGTPFAIGAIACGIIALMKGRSRGAFGKASGVMRAVVGIVLGVIGLIISLIACAGFAMSRR